MTFCTHTWGKCDKNPRPDGPHVCKNRKHSGRLISHMCEWCRDTDEETY